MIAQVLCKETGIPYLPDTLCRRKATPSQGYMGFKDRKKNVRGAFAIDKDKQEALAGKTVVLIDDVYTTGATVKECAKTLLKAGVREVHVLAVARVVKRD